MNILMISRSTLFSSPGGDTIQMIKTAEELRNLNVNVDIKLTNDKIEYKNYDLIHFFNIIRPADILYHIKKSKLRYVVSTIFVDYTEFEKQVRSGFRSIVFKLLSGDTIEYLKAIVKHVLRIEKIMSLSYIFLGHKRSVKLISSNAEALLPNSKSELERFITKYNTKPKDATIVPNGIEIKKYEDITQNEKFVNSIVCVGRIEGRKNQLNLIKAMKDINIPLYIIGNVSPNSKDYLNSCQTLAKEYDHIHFIPHIDQLELYAIMKAAKVHVLPSWFETTGLVSLEAAYLDTNIVVTHKGDQDEYFQDLAEYCEPDDIVSIKNAILSAYNRPVTNDLKIRIEENYTWEQAAINTLEAYKKTQV